jgi:triosephosphate isomerase
MKKYIIANWKSNKTLSEVSYWLNNFPSNNDESRKSLDALEIIIAPPYPFLALAKEIIDKRHLPIKLAVQDLSPFGSGSYTGEVAAFNLQDLNVEYAILGHSERRRFLAETPQLVADKVTEALNWKIKPILCLDKTYFSEQARFLKNEALSQCLLAYEPVAAIGSGQAESAGNLLAIRNELKPIYDSKTLIYGGSVNADNVVSFLKVCDGVLLGGASLNLADFLDLLFTASQGLLT